MKSPSLNDSLHNYTPLREARVSSFSIMMQYVAWLQGEPSRKMRQRVWNSNRLFYLFLIASASVLTLVGFWPTLQPFSMPEEVTTTASELVLAPQKPFYRTTPFKLAAFCAAWGGTYYAWRYRYPPQRALRTLLLLGACGYFALVVLVHERLIFERRVLRNLSGGNIFELQWQNLQRLSLIECEPLVLQSFEVREQLRRQDLQSFAAFHRCVMECYAAEKPRLKGRWPEMKEDQRKTLFVMNFVAGFWSFGNRFEPEKPGSVFGNEQNGWESPPETLQAYLDSSIACCEEFAYVTKSLLDHEGIENRLTCIPGHIFNEVRIDGQWWIADATANFFLKGSWDELYQRTTRDGPIMVWVFPHPHLSNASSSRYRARAGSFRLMALTRIANHSEFLRSATHPDLPDYFD